MARYRIKIVARDGLGVTSDDWLATVTRISDGTTFVYVAYSLWWLRVRTNRYWLDRDFKMADRRTRRLMKTFTEEK